MSEVFSSSGERTDNVVVPTPRLQGLFIPSIDNPEAIDGFGTIIPWGGGSTTRRYSDYGISADISTQNTQLRDLASSFIPAEGDGITYDFEGLIGPQGIPGRDGIDGITHFIVAPNSNFLAALPHNIDQINDLGTALNKLVYTSSYDAYFGTPTWTERQPAGAVSKLWFSVASDSDGSNLIAGVEEGRLYTSDDYGATWTERQPAGAVDDYWAVVASDSDGSNLIAGSDEGGLYTSSNSGVNWTERQPAGAGDKWWAAVASDSDGSNLIAGISGGRLYTSSNSGANWTERQPAGAGDKDWRSAASDSDGSHLIAGDYGRRLWTSANSGVSWTERRPAGDFDKNWTGVASDSDGSHLIVTDQARLYTSDDYGATWTERQPAGAVSKIWVSVASDSDGSHLIAGVEGGRLYISDDYGVSWTEEQPAGVGDKSWIGVASDSDGSHLIVAITSGRLYTGVRSVVYSEATWAESELTSAGRDILGDVTAADQATTLGLGTGDSPTFTGLTLSSIAAEATDVDKFLVDSTGVIKFRTGVQVLSDIGASASGHLHDGDTLQLDGINSNGGAFSFATTGLVTFNQSIAAANYAASNLLTAAATNAGELDFTVGSKKLDVEDNAVVSQDYSSNANPEFAGLTLSGLTQGSIIFAGSGGVLSQDNSNLFWDDTNNRLKIKGDIVYHGTSYILSGMSEERQDMFLTTSVGNVFFEVEKIGGGDIEYLFDEIEYDLDCTTGSGTGGRAQVQLTEGSATNPQINYIYITLVASTATLTASTSLPTGRFAWVALVVIQSDTEIDAVGYGPLAYQRFTETYKHDDRGALSYMREKIRYLGADYLSGMAQSLTITANGGADTVVLTTASGKVYQLHRQDWPAYNISSDGIWVANASGAGTLTNYQKLTDLNAILETTDGTVIGNNKRFNLVIWGSINFSTGDCKLFVNLPTGVYQDDDQTISDENGTAVTTIPAEFQTTGFLIARLPLKYSTAGGGTWTNLMGGTSVIDLRGLPTGFNLGSGATVGATATFSDADFEVFDNGDDTKRLMFQVSGVSTGNTRTLTIPNVSGTLVTSANPEDLGGVLQDLDTLGAPASDGQFIVATGSGVFAYEATTVVRTSLGLGTGDSPQFTGIELGHASDTTITRASAGNLNIEGNLVYRAGGTDVPIGDGGTGQSTAQAAIDALSAVSGATNEHVLTKDTASGNAIWKAAAAGGAHAILDGSVHSDSVADAVTRGSIIYGNATPKWDELVKGAANTFLGSDGTDVSYRTAAQTMASLSGAATAAFDLNGQDLTNGGVIFLTEQAAAEADVAGKGQLWVKTITPNELWFTDDAGSDFQIGGGLITRVRIHLSADQAITGGGWRIIEFNTVDIDARTEYDTVNYEFVADETGYYTAFLSAVIEVPVDTNYYYLKIEQSGSVAKAVSTYFTASGAAAQTMIPVGNLFYLVAGDKLIFYVYTQTSKNISGSTTFAYITKLR